jgi:Plant transposon protein
MVATIVHRWRCMQCPVKDGSSVEERRCSKWAESMRKDSEYCFGILKGRWRILKTGIKLQSRNVIDDVLKVASSPASCNSLAKKTFLPKPRPDRSVVASLRSLPNMRLILSSSWWPSAPKYLALPVQSKFMLSSSISILCNMQHVKKTSSITFLDCSFIPVFSILQRPFGIPKQYSLSFLIDSAHFDRALHATPTMNDGSHHHIAPMLLLNLEFYRLSSSN